MLNRRRKAILFVTLVATGSALLAGTTLGEGLGILILGVACTWLAGSEVASRAYDYVRSLPGLTWPWVRLLILMAFGSGLLVAVAFWSNMNSFLIATAMCIWGMLISPFSHLPTQRRWMKGVVWSLGVMTFSVGAAVAAGVLTSAIETNERMGRQAAYGLLALAVGLLWLVKAWSLALRGITAAPAPGGATQTQGATPAKGTKWLYVSLFGGTVVLTISLALLAFSAFSDSTFQMEAAPNRPTTSNPLSSAIFLILLGWCPYACWKRILDREPNTTPVNVRTHRRVTAVLTGLFTVALCLAAAFGVQSGSDRKTTAEVEGAAKGFQNLAGEIAAIKARDLRTTRDYIDAYEEIDPLLVQFDAKLQHFTDILSEARQRDEYRGPLNIQRLYGDKEQQWQAWDQQLFQLLRQDSQLTRQQIAAVRKMAALPEERQVAFWEKKFPTASQGGIRNSSAASFSARQEARRNREIVFSLGISSRSLAWHQRAGASGYDFIGHQTGEAEFHERHQRPPIREPESGWSTITAKSRGPQTRRSALQGRNSLLF